MADELFFIAGELFPTYWIKKWYAFSTKNIYQLF